GDLTEDTRDTIVWGSLCTIVRGHFRFQIAVYESWPKNSQRRNSKWNVELHVKCGRCQNHCADRRRVIVYPGCQGDRSETMLDHDHVFDRDAELFRNMPREGVYILNHVVETFCGAAIACRTTMTARVPGEDRDFVKV